uniref:helix-turn-helix transcriptional regulator n=1 Tax=Cellulomonas hominis TaxID=156981 RepID=UPI001E436D44|nr:helix-turn-helix transcriptional regulator [Cellulomonas hominis]
MHPLRVDDLLLVEGAAVRTLATPPERTRGLLEVLRRAAPFDAAFLAFADPWERRYYSLATVDLDDTAVRFLEGPRVARDTELTGTDRARLPLGPSDLPYPAEELPTWAECLIPSGLREGLGVALFADGRHVGHLAVLLASPAPPSAATRRRLARLAPPLARGLDPLSSLLAVARLVQGGHRGRGPARRRRVPGGPGAGDHPPAAPGVAGPHARAAARARRTGQLVVPLAARRGARSRRARADHHPERVGRRRSRPARPGAALPAPPLHGLTPRELEVLGLLVEGCTNPDIACRLVVTPRTVATHLEHILAKLGTPTRTHAAVRAERDGLYVPAVPG